jgi:hypothetical protein
MVNCSASTSWSSIDPMMGTPPIHHRKDAQPVLHTADDVERSGEDDWGIQ